MVAYFCHHLSDNYVDLSDLYVDLSAIYVDLSDHYVDMAENIIKIHRLISCLYSVLILLTASYLST